ncbi:MAG: DMT family transporter [Bacteroidales bacterium]|nr:DMT family transporter [Bacteroidales bacterium]
MPERRKIWHWLVLAALSVIWGTSYILMKKGLESFSTFQIASLRVIIAFLCLLPIAIRNLNKLNKDNFRSVIIIGFLGSGIPAFLFPLAQTKIDSSLAGMLNSLSPVFTLVIGIWFYKKKAIRSQIAGVFLGLLGAIGLLYSGSFTFNYYGLYVVLATLLYGISSNEVSKVKGINGLQITSLAFFFLSPFAVVLLLFTDIQAAMETEHWLRNLGFIAILSVFGSAVALALFYLLIRDTSPVFASIVTYFIPVVATLWGIADNEHLSSSMLVSVILILAGVNLINRPGLLKNVRRNFK